MAEETNASERKWLFGKKQIRVYYHEGADADGFMGAMGPDVCMDTGSVFSVVYAPLSFAQAYRSMNNDQDPS